MGQYCSIEQVRLRLVGKVQFDPQGVDPNKMSYALANLLISEGEGQVELDLSPRYSAPFQTDAGNPFSQLPLTTVNIIKNLAELLGCIRILETDFGRGTVVEADKYTEKIQDRYDKIVSKLLEKKSATDYRNWMYPPLPGLMLNYMNITADDGFSGSVHVTSKNHGDYPTERINDPSSNFWSGELDRGWDW